MFGFASEVWLLNHTVEYLAIVVCFFPEISSDLEFLPISAKILTFKTVDRRLEV
jgi:hypothetical protein